MKAAVVTSYDAPPHYGVFADPTPAEGEKVVTVTAAGLAHLVKAIARGAHYGSSGQLPLVPGVDGVGRLEDGTRVYFMSARAPFGTMAERSLAADRMCLPLPEGISDTTAAGIANPGMSSWVALSARAKFVAGESVLILGATGVAGQMAIQIAKRRGASRVVAAGRSRHALEKLAALGADTVISLEQEPTALAAAFRREFAEAGVDVVLDYLWGKPAESVIAAIGQKGIQPITRRVRYVQIGEIAGSNISLAGSTLRSTALEILGSGLGSSSFQQLKTAISELFQSAAEKPFQFETRVAPLSDVEAMWNSPDQGVRLVFQP